MDRLRRRELALKANGRWDEIDLLQYVADQLRTLDTMAYTDASLGGGEEVEEIARTEIANGAFAVVCRSRAGIYEVEQTLRRLHGDRLGVVVLQTRSSAYSLRQVDPTLPGRRFPLRFCRGWRIAFLPRIESRRVPGAPR